MTVEIKFILGEGEAERQECLDAWMEKLEDILLGLHTVKAAFRSTSSSDIAIATWSYWKDAISRLCSNIPSNNFIRCHLLK